MGKKYQIRAGFSFSTGNGTVLEGGETIELEDDVAKLHMHKLEVLEPAKPPPKQEKKPVAPKAQKPEPPDTPTETPPPVDSTGGTQAPPPDTPPEDQQPGKQSEQP